MKLIASAVYGAALLLILLIGACYHDLQQWSFFAAGAVALHLGLSLLVASLPVLDAGRIIAGTWIGISTFVTAALLMPFATTQSPIWLIAAVTLVLITLILVLVICTVMKPGGAADHRPRPAATPAAMPPPPPPPAPENK